MFSTHDVTRIIPGIGVDLIGTVPYAEWSIDKELTPVLQVLTNSWSVLTGDCPQCSPCEPAPRFVDSEPVARVPHSASEIHQGLSPVFAKCPGVDRTGTVPGVLVVRRCFECTVSSQDLPLPVPRQELNSHRGAVLCVPGDCPSWSRRSDWDSPLC